VKLSVLDLYTIGIGPSSSHTVGPMRAAARFAAEAAGLDPCRVRADLYGSLALTEPSLPLRHEQALASGRLPLAGRAEVAFDPATDLVFNRRASLPFHPNGMRFSALDQTGRSVLERVFYSVGGGFVVAEDEATAAAAAPAREVPHPFSDAARLIDWCDQTGLPVSGVILANEAAWRPQAETLERLDRVWLAMQACVEAGLHASGTLPGGLAIPRRAPALYRKLCDKPESALRDSLTILDWVDAYAIAVNEENAAGGRVVTAPTNGAAGIIPAVMHYCDRFLSARDPAWHRAFLLTAGAVGLLFKENASISGADVGCQGEVGVACSMAAGALAEFMGGDPKQVENAAEIGMEHNLGLTCDPVGGLVQIPCIERNAMGAVKAINAARIALRGDGRHAVSLDAVIRTMRDTGRDMRRKYKETSRGGLAVNVVEC